MFGRFCRHHGVHMLSLLSWLMMVRESPSEPQCIRGPHISSMGMTLHAQRPWNLRVGAEYGGPRAVDGVRRGGGSGAGAAEITWRMAALRGGGVEEGGGHDNPLGEDFEVGDSGLEDSQDYGGDRVKPPWPQMEGEQEEERELAKNVKDGSFILGKDKWYDDFYSSVGKNSQGKYDSFHDQEEGFEEDYNTMTLDECKDDSNEEGYLGEATEEVIAMMYPAMKERYKWYERNVTLDERPEGHRLKVGDLVTLAPLWREKTLGNYTSNKGLPDVPSLDEVSTLPFNDAHGGPLFPEDVGIILQDDNTTKPYLVKAFTSAVYKEGYPYEWTDEWWYIAEALQLYIPPRPLGLADDATVLVPDNFPSVKLALLNMTEGQSLLVKSGDGHRFDEVLELGEHPHGTHPAHKNLKIRTLNMECSAGARSWGRMIFGRWARGNLRRAFLLYTTLNSVRGVIECHGGPWRLIECEVRSAGGTAVKVMTEGNVTAENCGLGGYAWPISINSASDAVYCQHEARVRLTGCKLDKTGRLGGVGLYAEDTARVVAVGCTWVQNDHAVGYNDCCTIKMYGCVVSGCRNEAFYGGLRSLRSKLVLCGNRIDGPMWFRGRLPEYLGLRGEYPGDNVMGPIPDIRRFVVKALNLSMPQLDDRIQFRARITAPVHWDGEHTMSGT